MNDWLTIALALGLAARLTRLITLDTITQPIRDRLSGFFAALVECPWCSGVWTAVAVGLSWMWWADQTWWQVTALIGTIAWVAGAAAGVGGPRQVEVATVSPVALVHVDEPPQVDTIEHTVELSTDLTDAEIEKVTEQVFKRMNRRGAIEDDGTDGSY
jgi:hypothetical protein